MARLSLPFSSPALSFSLASISSSSLPYAEALRDLSAFFPLEIIHLSHVVPARPLTLGIELNLGRDFSGIVCRA
jgi:hypothetical protein